VSEASIIDGKAIAARLRADIAEEAAAFRTRHGRAPGLQVVLVGEHPASRVYVRTKARMAAEAGIDSDVVHLPDTITEGELLAAIAELNRNPAVDGILVQLRCRRRSPHPGSSTRSIRPRTSTAFIQSMSAGCSRAAAGSIRGCSYPARRWAA